MKEAFQNFSGADYIEGACLTYENAKRHLIASELLITKKLYGIAISHLILGAEEYIKALILLNLSGDSYFIDDTDKVELFRNHKFKHNNIVEFRRISQAARRADRILKIGALRRRRLTGRARWVLPVLL